MEICYICWRSMLFGHCASGRCEYSMLLLLYWIVFVIVITGIQKDIKKVYLVLYFKIKNYKTSIIRKGTILFKYIYSIMPRQDIDVLCGLVSRKNASPNLCIQTMLSNTVSHIQK
eukprot:16380_1